MEWIISRSHVLGERFVSSTKRPKLNQSVEDTGEVTVRAVQHCMVEQALGTLICDAVNARGRVSSCGDRCIRSSGLREAQTYKHLQA